jgi:hypothetical protein
MAVNKMMASILSPMSAGSCVTVAKAFALYDCLFAAIAETEPKIFSVSFFDRLDCDQLAEALAGNIDHNRFGHGDLPHKVAGQVAVGRLRRSTAAH